MLIIAFCKSSLDNEISFGNMLGEAGFSVEKISKISSKLAERLRLPGFTFFLPHVMWRLIDYLLCSIFGRQSFMVIKAKNSD